MGRFYHGDICGKFWFGIQSSDDASNLGGKIQLVYRFHVCGCEYECEQEDPTEHNNKVFCMNCYKSYEEHLQALYDDNINNQEEEEPDKKEEETLWYLNESEIFYSFQSEKDLPWVEKCMNHLQEKVGEYIQTFCFLDDTENEHFEYDVELSPLFQQEFNNGKIQQKQQTLEEIARLCLAKQIFHCLQQKGECAFYAET